MIKEESFIGRVSLSKSNKQKRITVPLECKIEGGDYVRVIRINPADHVTYSTFKEKEPIDWLDLRYRVENNG